MAKTYRKTTRRTETEIEPTQQTTAPDNVREFRGTDLSALAEIRDTVPASVKDRLFARMDDNVKKVVANPFFREVIEASQFEAYANSKVGPGGQIELSLIVETFGLDSSMPDPAQWPSYCDKCHRKFAVAYRFRPLSDDGVPSTDWSGQFGVIPDQRESARGKLKVGRFCPDCRLTATLPEKSKWQTYEAASKRLQGIIEAAKHRREQSAADREKAERERKLAAETEEAEELKKLLG